MKAAGSMQLAAGAVFAVLCASPVFAQDRLPPIAADKLTDAQKKAFAEFRGRRTVPRGGGSGTRTQVPFAGARTAMWHGG